MTNDLLIALLETIQCIRDANVFAEFHNKFLASAEVVPWNPWEQVMHGLELKTAVEEIEPFRAVDIHGSAQHALRERLGDAKVCCRHGEV